LDGHTCCPKEGADDRAVRRVLSTITARNANQTTECSKRAGSQPLRERRRRLDEARWLPAAPQQTSVNYSSKRNLCIVLRRRRHGERRRYRNDADHDETTPRTPQCCLFWSSQTRTSFQSSNGIQSTDRCSFIVSLQPPQPLPTNWGAHRLSKIGRT